MTSAFKNKEINWWKIIFVIFVAAYMTVLLINPQLGSVTDDVVFLRTLQSGHLMYVYGLNFPYYDAIKWGRFMPIANQEYNIFGLFSNSPSPFWYYLFHAVQFFIFMFLLAKLISKSTSNKWFIYGIPILFSLTSSVIVPWFRLQLNERNAIFFFAAFLLCYLAYTEKRRWFYAVLSVLFAGLAVYAKETAFITLGAFAFIHLFFTWKTADKKVKILDFALWLVSLSYIIVYYFYVYINKGPIPYQSGFELYNFLKVTLVNYFLSDPLIFLIILPLTVWRTYQIFVKKQNSQPIYDAMLIAASTYPLAFFVLHIQSSYYLLPAYAFALPALIYFFTRDKLTWSWKIALFISGFIIIFSVIPSGLHTLTWLKAQPVNFNKTLDFLIEDIKQKYPNGKANIFMDAEQWDYFVLAEFLRFKGLSENQFDLKTNQKITPYSLLFVPIKIKPPYTIFSDEKTILISQPLRGDYFVVSANGNKRQGDDYDHSLDKDYQLIFSVKSRFIFPMVDIKSLARYLILKTPILNKAVDTTKRTYIFDSPNYYVFIHK